MRSSLLHNFLTLLLLITSFPHISGQQLPEPIAHGLGAINGIQYTNSREALQNSIEKGYKFLEVDMDSTSDGVLIASHDWESFNLMTHCSERKDTIGSFEEFSNRKIAFLYTPITIREVVDTIKKHPDISLVTDKISDPNIIEKCYSEIKEQVYVECFTEEDYFELKARGYHAMLSTYNTDNTFSKIIKNLLSGTGRIDFVATSTNQNFRELEKLRCVVPLRVSMFSINDEKFLQEHANEIDYYYTDFYNPLTGEFENP